MKITKQTPTTLIIEHKGNLPFGSFAFIIVFIIVASLPILLPILIYILSYELKTLECKRVKPTQVGCILTSVDWLGLEGLGTKRMTFIPAVQGAKAITTTETKEKVDEDGDKSERTYYYHQLVLVTSGDKTVLSIPTSTAQDATAARINSFIKDQSQTTLTILLSDIVNIFFILSTSSVMIISFIILNILVLLLLVLLLVSLSRLKCPVMWAFDKKSGNLHVTFKNMIRQSETKRYRLQDIQSAKVIREESTDSDGERMISYKTQLDMRSGEPIHLSSSNDHKITEAINRFLGTPKSQRSRE